MVVFPRGTKSSPSQSAVLFCLLSSIFRLLCIADKDRGGDNETHIAFILGEFVVVFAFSSETVIWRSSRFPPFPLCPGYEPAPLSLLHFIESQHLSRGGPGSERFFGESVRCFFSVCLSFRHSIDSVNVYVPQQRQSRVLVEFGGT